MADVTLAECAGQLWLVGGEEHFNALLFNDLPPDVEVKVVQCATRADMYTVWRALTPDADETDNPWALNPKLRARLLMAAGPFTGTVRFTPWSAMLGPEAEESIGVAAAWLASNPAGRLTIRQCDPGDAAPGLEDLQRLRRQLVMAALLRAGADAGRMREEMVAATRAEEAEQLMLITEPALSGPA